MHKTTVSQTVPELPARVLEALGYSYAEQQHVALQLQQYEFWHLSMQELLRGDCAKAIYMALTRYPENEIISFLAKEGLVITKVADNWYELAVDGAFLSVRIETLRRIVVLSVLNCMAQRYEAFLLVSTYVHENPCMSHCV